MRARGGRGFRRRRKNRFPGRSRQFVFMYRVQDVVFWCKCVLQLPEVCSVNVVRCSPVVSPWWVDYIPEVIKQLRDKSSLFFLTLRDTFSNKENFVWLVLGCINDFLSFVFSSGRRASKYYAWASPEPQIQPKKVISRRRRKPRPPRARTRISLETFSL